MAATDRVRSRFGSLVLAFVVNACGASGGPATSPTVDAPPERSPGQISLGAAAYTAAEAGASVTVSVTRVGGSDGEVTVRVTTEDDTAVAGADFASLDTTVVFADHDSEPKLVVLTLVDDAGAETDETFRVTLSQPGGGATLAAPTQASITIVDDDGTGGVIFRGPGGVSLATNKPGTPADLTVTAVAAPAEPLPPGATALGAHYQLTADRDIFVPTTDPFILSVPVPPGSPTDHLALAVQVPLEDVLDGAAAGAGWERLSGMFDPAKNTFVVPLSFLSAAGTIIVLIEHPDFASPAKASRAHGASEVINGFGVDLVGFDFFVQCVDFPPGGCPDSLRNELALLLETARGDLRTTGTVSSYPEPRLPVHFVELAEPPHALTAVGFDVFLQPEGSRCTAAAEPAQGYYEPRTAHLYVCVPAGATNLSDLGVRTGLHEYFHASQFAFPKVMEGPRAPFLIEGSAAAAELSYGRIGPELEKMFRSPDFAVHPVDIPIRSIEDDDEYRAQDVWVYESRRFDLDLDYLVPVFNAGGSLEAIDQNLRGDTLKQLYWAWAKNQVMEKDITMDGALRFPPCLIEPDAVETRTAAFGMQIIGNPWRWVPLDEPVPYQESLTPLTSSVVRVLPGDGFPLGSMTISESSGGDIVIKVYQEFTGDCGGGIPDGRRTIDHPALDKDIYVLVANRSLTETKTFTLTGIGEN